MRKTHNHKNVASNRGHDRGQGQSDKFKEAARKLGVDEDSDRFDEVMRELAKKPPAPREKPKLDKK